MGVHDIFVDLAERLISKNGRAVSIRRTTVTTTSGKPWEVLSSGTSSDDTSTIAVFLTAAEADKLLALPGIPDQRTVISEVRQVALIAAKGLSITPMIKDQLVDGIVIHEIVSVDGEKPGTQDTFFMLGLST